MDGPPSRTRNRSDSMEFSNSRGRATMDHAKPKRRLSVSGALRVPANFSKSAAGNGNSTTRTSNPGAGNPRATLRTTRPSSPMMFSQSAKRQPSAGPAGGPLRAIHNITKLPERVAKAKRKTQVDETLDPQDQEEGEQHHPAPSVDPAVDPALSSEVQVYVQQISSLSTLLSTQSNTIANVNKENVDLKNQALKDRQTIEKLQAQLQDLTHANEQLKAKQATQPAPSRLPEERTTLEQFNKMLDQMSATITSSSSGSLL